MGEYYPFLMGSEVSVLRSPRGLHTEFPFEHQELEPQPGLALAYNRGAASQLDTGSAPATQALWPLICLLLGSWKPLCGVGS